MKKRIISLFLVLSMLLCVLPSVSAADVAPVYKIYSSYLTLNESIDINFTTNTVLPDDYTVKFTVGGVEGGAEVSTKTKNGRPVYTYTELTPRDLGKTVIVTIYDENNELVDSKSSSVLGYCESMLSKDSTSGNLKQLLVDLLNYGAAAQIKFDSASNPTLVNESLTLSQQALATKAIPTLTDNRDSAGNDGTVKWQSVSLALENSVLIRFDVDAAGDGKTLKVFDGDTLLGTETISYSDLSETYCAYFDGLNPTQMRKTITAQVFDGETAVSTIATFKIEDYAAYAVTNKTTEALLCQYMMKYGDAAAAWWNNKTGSPTQTTLVCEDFNNKTIDTLKNDTTNWTVRGSSSLENNKLKLTKAISGFDSMFAAASGKIAVEFEFTYVPTNCTPGQYTVNFVIRPTGGSGGSFFQINKNKEATKNMFWCGGDGSANYRSDLECVSEQTYDVKVILDTTNDTVALYVDDELIINKDFTFADNLAYVRIVTNYSGTDEPYIMIDDLVITQLGS